MDDRDCLAHYPFVVVRIACRVCSRSGSYRRARLAAKFGPEISLRDLLDRFSYDCRWRAVVRAGADGDRELVMARWGIPARRSTAAHQLRTSAIWTVRIGAG